MATMSDLFKRGFLFNGTTGLKTGANLEDLVTRACPVTGSQLVDQVTLEDYADPSLVDDDGAALRRFRVKGGGLGRDQLSAALQDELFWGGPELLVTIFGSAALAAAGMQTIGTWNTAPTDVANIFDRDEDTSWGDAKVSANSTVHTWWDLGATYRGNIFCISALGPLIDSVAATMGGWCTPYSPVAGTVPLRHNTVMDGPTSTALVVHTFMPFYGRYVGVRHSGGNAVTTHAVRRIEVYGRAVA